MKPSETHERRDDVQILDVREADEWTAGHIEDAHHLPMDQVPARRDEIATDRTVVTVCRSGSRSGEVADELRSAGYDAQNMDGGLQAWSSEGLPLVSEDGAPPRVE